LLARAKARGGTTLGQHLLVLVVAAALFLLDGLGADGHAGRSIVGSGIHHFKNRMGLALMTLGTTYGSSAILGAQIANLRLLIDLHFRAGPEGG
jgi:hypothetical protein